MGIDEDNRTDDEATEKGDEPVFDFWSDEGARLFNEALDEGSAYMLERPGSCDDFEEHLYDEQCEYVNPGLDDPDEETLPPDVFESSYFS